MTDEQCNANGDNDPDNPGNINLGLESLKGISAQAIQALLGFIGTVVFANVLGPSSFGGFYFLLSLVTLATRPLDGFGNAVRKRFSEQDAPRTELVGIVFSFNTVAFLLAGGAVWFLREVIRTQTNVPNAALVFLLLFISLGSFLPVQKLIGGVGRPAVQVWNDTLRSILTLPLQLGFVLAGAGAAGMGYGLAAATLLTVPVGLFVVRVRPVKPSFETLRSVWDFARYSIPTALVGAAYGRFDVLVIGTFLTTATVGYYEVAYRLTVPATFVTTALAGALMPKVSNLHSRGDAIADDITNAISYNSILAIPMFFGAAALARPTVVTVYGGDYAAAAPFLVGLALYQVFATQTSIYQRTMSGVDRPDLDFRIDAATLVFNLVVGLALLFTIGAIGVVVATVLAQLIRLLLSVWVVQNLVPDVESLPRPLLDQVVAAGILFVIVEAVISVVTVRSWLDLIVLVGFGMGIYGSTLLGISAHARVTARSLYADIWE